MIAKPQAPPVRPTDGEIVGVRAWRGDGSEELILWGHVFELRGEDAIVRLNLNGRPLLQPTAIVDLVRR